MVCPNGGFLIPSESPQKIANVFTHFHGCFSWFPSVENCIPASVSEPGTAANACRVLPPMFYKDVSVSVFARKFAVVFVSGCGNRCKEKEPPHAAKSAPAGCGNLFAGCFFVFLSSCSAFFCSYFLSGKVCFFGLEVNFLVQMLSTVSLGAKPPDPHSHLEPAQNPKKKIRSATRARGARADRGENFAEVLYVFPKSGSKNQFFLRSAN